MQPRIGIALSGGGVRAMAFHAGVLEWLATNNLLERVSALSTVSGGSLIAGLAYRLNDWEWPSSKQYLTSVLPELRRILTTVCLQREASALLLQPSNWQYLFSRANVLAQAISRCWDINATVAALGKSCEWSINGTTAETGRRFRFKQGRCGDYATGYASARDFPLAMALAASAAYPLLIGPLRVDATKFNWYRRSGWGGSQDDEEAIKPPHKTLHLIDGGVYDNLGMEPLFDIAKQSVKLGIDSLIVSDAGAAFQHRPLQSQWNISRLSRVLEISMDQARALRVRPFVTAIIANPSLGRYYQIGSNAEAALNKFGHGDIQKPPFGSWLSETEAKFVSHWPTDLKKLTLINFNLISRHGFETAAWNEQLFSQENVQ